MLVKSLQLGPTLFKPMDCSPPGFSVHGILQAQILEWVAVPSSQGTSQTGPPLLCPGIDGQGLCH